MVREVSGQIDLFSYQTELERSSALSVGCEACVCNNCLYWWSGRCPHGGCYDDFRAKANPYNKAHPDKPPRMGWSNWRNDQARWCRGGAFYPVRYCERFAKLTRTQVRQCLLSNVVVYQDGYIQCSIVETIGCEECYRRFEEEAKEDKENEGNIVSWKANI